MSPTAPEVGTELCAKVLGFSVMLARSPDNALAVPTPSGSTALTSEVKFCAKVVVPVCGLANSASIASILEADPEPSIPTSVFKIDIALALARA